MLSASFNALAGFTLPLTRARTRSSGARTRPARGAAGGLPAPPAAADWAWAPDLSLPEAPSGPTGSGAEVLPGLSLHHDCPRGQVHVDPLPGPGFRLSPQGFDGSFLSLALDLPQPALDGLRRHHIVGLAVSIDSLAPVTTYGRLNILHGPNTEVLLRALPVAACGRPGTRIVAFDLAETELDDWRQSRGWLDLIFESPGDTGLQINDIALHRRPRAVL